MKLTRSLLYTAAAAGLVALTSCAEQQDENYNQYESMSLKAWVTQHAPRYVTENFLPVGESGLYFDVLEAGSEQAEPIAGGDMWVTFDFSGRDMDGNVVLTRSADEAKLLNTFTKYTRYVPFYRFVGSTNSGLTEGAYLAMRSTLTMSENYFNEYAAERGFDSREIRLREGSRVVFYMPSILIGESGVSGSGGYEGQTSLAASRPMRVVMEIRDTVDNPLRVEGNRVDGFCDVNGGRETFNTTDNPLPEDTSDPRHPYNPASKRWVSACDTVAQLYVNYRYDPKTDRFDFPQPYNVGYAPYNDPELDKKISDALIKRFHTDKEYAGIGLGESNLKADSVGMDGTAKIWYIGRFLDGFIFDTNIDEVKELIYDKGYTAGSALSYTPSSGGLIQSFYYTVPKLQYGQWAAFITTSTNAYGSSGKSGSTSTSSSSGSSSSSLDYINYLNYVNNYYGGYYGGYYDNYYGYDYYGGYYGDYYGSNYDSTTTTTTTTVTTEIPSFEPLIFQFYVEPK